MGIKNEINSGHQQLLEFKGRKKKWNWVFQRLNEWGWKILPPMDVVQSYSYGMHIMANLILFVIIIINIEDWTI